MTQPWQHPIRRKDWLRRSNTGSRTGFRSFLGARSVLFTNRPTRTY